MLTVTLPWPGKALSPNARLHWSRKSAAMKRYRSDCWKLTLGATGASPSGLPDQIPLAITFCPPDRRRRDRDNLIASFKAGQDGIADALGVDDSRFVPTYHMGDVVKGGAVIVGEQQ